jgi:hypothetical protein
LRTVSLVAEIAGKQTFMANRSDLAGQGMSFRPNVGYNLWGVLVLLGDVWATYPVSSLPARELRPGGSSLIVAAAFALRLKLLVIRRCSVAAEEDRNATNP